MKFWNWLKERLSITTMNDRLTAMEHELTRLHKKIIRPPKRYDQIERLRSYRKHPARHA